MTHRKAKRPVDEAMQRWPQEHQEWAESFHLGLVLSDTDDDVINGELDAQLETVRASGQDPETLFGEALEFGLERGAHLAPVAEREERKRMFRTLGGTIKFAVIGVCGTMLILGLWLGMNDGFTARSWLVMHPISFGLAGLLIVAGYWGWIEFTRGRLRQAWSSWASGLLVLLGFALVFEGLNVDDQRPLPVDNYWVLLGGLAVIILTLAIKTATPPKQSEAHLNDEPWFKRVKYVLIGRYTFLPREATAALAEARQHLADCKLEGESTGAEEQFGSAESFAAQLAASSRKSIARFLRLTDLGFALLLIFYANNVIDPMRERDFSLWTWVQTIAWLFWFVLWALRLLPRRRREEIAKRQKQRIRDARATAGAEAGDE